MNTEHYKPIVDALIFASETPLSVQKIRQILLEGQGDEGVSAQEIRKVIEEINRDNRENQRGFYLQEVAGGYQYRTRPNYAQWIKKLKKPKPFRLTQSTLETLAIIAYKQPITRAEIDTIRGVDSGGTVKNLLERDLIKIAGRKDIPGRPFVFATTRRFLEVFGFEKLSDLPNLREFDDIDASQLPTILRDQVPDEILSDQDDDMSRADSTDRRAGQDDTGLRERHESGSDDPGGAEGSSGAHAADSDSQSDRSRLQDDQ